MSFIEAPSVAPATAAVAQIPTEQQGDVTPPQEVPQEPVKSEQEILFARRFNALAQREKKLNEERKAFAQQMEEWKRESEKYKKFDNIKERLLENPGEVFEELGTSYDDVTKQLISGAKTEEQKVISQLQKRIEELENGIKGEKEEFQKRQVEETEKTFLNSIKSHISNNEKYELMSKSGEDAVEMAYNLILEYYNKTQKVLSTEEACSLVEEHLESQFKAYSDSAKIKLLMGLAKNEPAAPQQATEQVGETSPKTLSNSMAPNTSALPKTLSREDSLKQAAGLLRWSK